MVGVLNDIHQSTQHKEGTESFGHGLQAAALGKLPYLFVAEREGLEQMICDASGGRVELLPKV